MNEIILYILSFLSLSFLVGAITAIGSKWGYMFITILLSLLLFTATKYAPTNKQEIFPFLLLCTIPALCCSFFLNWKNDKSRNRFKSIYKFVLQAADRTEIEFLDPFDNFLCYAGANSGKTKSIGKPLLEQYIKNNFAGFIYDYKDFDYTKTAYNLCKKHSYPHKFYYISFTDVQRSYRFNPIKPSVLKNENLFIQLMDDLLSAYLIEGKKDEWFQFGMGILKGVSYRFYAEFPQYCTIPHIANFIMHAGKTNITKFVSRNVQSKALASAFIEAEDSDKTQASMLSSLTGYISTLAFNKEVCYILSGDDFDFNLIDPDNPKMISVSNSFQIESMISPVVSLLVNLSARRFKFGNKIPFVYFLDEATTFKIQDFEKLPSVLREYLASFVLLTQSGAKIEKTYSKLDRSSVESNFSNLIIGRTKDTEALKYYSLFFGKKEIEKQSHTRSAINHSVTLSKMKEEVYEPHFFTSLKAGEFIGSAAHSNYTDFHLQFKQYVPGIEDELPVVFPVLPSDIEKNYKQILADISNLIK